MCSPASLRFFAVVYRMHGPAWWRLVDSYREQARSHRVFVVFKLRGNDAADAYPRSFPVNTHL
jgi:hypothetical protein